MITILPKNEYACIPFHIGNGASESGPRLGGRPPEHIILPDGLKVTYFATIPIGTHQSIELSIFLSITKFAKFDVPNNKVAPLGEAVFIVSHEPRHRSSGEFTPGLSEMSEHPLLLGQQTHDECIESDGTKNVYSGHKIGGRPYLVQNRAKLIAQLEELQQKGWRQIVQFEYLAYGDSKWTGTWPFADGLFHLFSRLDFLPRSTTEQDWRFLWQY